MSEFMIQWAPDGVLSGNYADYQSCAPNVCCGWMDMHDDRHSGAEVDPMFRIRPLFWDEDAVLVVTGSGGMFEAVERSPKMVSFDATKLHGLMPRVVAAEVIERQDLEGPAYQAFSAMVEGSTTRPKMIWEFCHANGKRKRFQ